MLPRYTKRVKEMSGGRDSNHPLSPGGAGTNLRIARRRRPEGGGNGLRSPDLWKGMFPFTEWAWGIPFAFDVVDHYDYLWWEAGLTALTREAFATKNVFFMAPIYSDEWGPRSAENPFEP